MKLFIDRKLKIIYFFEVISMITIIVLIVLSIVLYINPEYIEKTNRDKTRENDLNAIANAIENYYHQDFGAHNFLMNIKYCGFGWSDIGIEEESINLESVLVPTFIDSLPKDPLQSNYRICRNSIGDRFVLQATEAETKIVEVMKKL